VLESPFGGLRDVLRLPLLDLLPLLRPWSSVDSDLARHFSDPRVRLAFSFQSKYLGMSPFQCPSLFTILSFIELEHGVFHPGEAAGPSSRPWPAWRATWACASTPGSPSSACCSRDAAPWVSRPPAECTGPTR